MNLHIKSVMHLITYLTLIVGIVSTYSCSSPKAAFLYDKQNYYVGEVVTFNNMSYNATEYQWLIDDDKKSEYSSIQVEHIFEESGNYNVKLNAIKGKKKSTATSQITLKAPEVCRVLLRTSHGPMVIELYDHTSLHRDNFIELIENGYYKDLLFHRVIDGFMAQAGDPDSRNADAGTRLGLGGPSYTIPSEMKDTLVHIKGALAAARAPDEVNPKKESSGSQFYIVHGRALSSSQLVDYELQKGIKYTPYARKVYESIGGAPQLDQEYTVFGHVVLGLDIIDKICSQSVDSADRPLEDIKILNAKVLK